VNNLNAIPRSIALEEDNAVGKVIITMKLYAHAIQAMQEDTVNSIRKNKFQMIIFLNFPLNDLIVSLEMND